MSNREATLSAIQNARKDYFIHKNATSEIIESREKFINGPNADQSAIDLAIHMNMVKIAPSGHKYIQLAIS